MTGTGDELVELLWDHGGPALRRPPPPFQPFTCSAAGSSRSDELRRHAKASPSFPPGLGGGMHDAGAARLGLAGLPPIQDDDDDAVPWLHCPVVDDGDADTAPLPPEYCAGLLSEYSGPAPGLPPARAAPPEAAADKVAPPTAGGGGGGGGGDAVMNFTFFSRPLQRPQASTAAAASNPVESTVVQAATNRLRSTPLFSEQRMAWLQPPKAPPPPRATVAAPPRPPPPPQAPQLPDNRRRGDGEQTAAQPRSHPEARPPDAAAVTTSSVCSGNGDRRQLKRSSHLPADGSVSADEDLDDEVGATRRSAAWSAKRSRTAEVHNLSERRRRDRINEKMRALQELIPNCNKIDKASMLEEAIEYLKTLQVQVQMMSMGTGLCMPPMLLPAAMHQHHLQAALMTAHHPMAHAHAHFPHLGMGLGFGMGAAAAFDMVPRVAAGAHFPCPPMAMPPGPMFGVPSPAAFAHVSGSGAAPAEQTEPDAAAARREGAEHPPAPVATLLTRADQKLQHEHPKQA